MGRAALSNLMSATAPDIDGDGPTIPLDPLDAVEDLAGVGWKRNKAGREYIVNPGRKGMLFRQGDESVGEAILRAGLPDDPAPKRKSKAGRHKPDPPPATDLRELEAMLAESFKSPAVVCAMAGDEWGAHHFDMAGPALARNLVVASQHNPWLRKKLEAASTGGDAAIQLMSMAALGGAIIMYVGPPVVHWFNLPVPDKAREMFGIPDRRPAEDAPRSPLAAAA
jgi:hypothetical protein